MGETATRKIRRATALSEMSILEEEGQHGYHLVDFGVLRLELEPSDHPWQHLRLVLPSPDALAALQEAGWLTGRPFATLPRLVTFRPFRHFDVS